MKKSELIDLVKSQGKRITELEAQLDDPITTVTKYDPDGDWSPFGACPTIEVGEVTLSGKVDAIIEHLGLDISVTPQKITGPSVKTTVVKKTKK